MQEVQEAARVKGVRLHLLRASNEGELKAAFATLIDLHAGGLLVGNDPFFFSRREQIVELASSHAVAAIYFFREFVAAGGLTS